MALAWPLRALHEAGHPDRIQPLLKTALGRSLKVHPTASCAEALVMIVHAVLPAGLRPANPAITALKTTASDSHWRVVRALVDVALLANAFDRQAAMDIASVIPVENKRSATVHRISEGEAMEPREFFW